MVIMLIWDVGKKTTFEHTGLNVKGSRCNPKIHDRNAMDGHIRSDVVSSK
jgi:hypothetical protein